MWVNDNHENDIDASRMYDVAVYFYDELQLIFHKIETYYLQGLWED